MAAATVVTNKGKAIAADRLRTSPGTYTVSPKFIGHGAGGGARTAAVTDTALTTEVDSRATGTESTVTTSVTGDTYQTQGTITAGAPRTLNEAATFDASSAGNIDVSATFADVGISTGDSVTYTFKRQNT